MKMTKLLPLIIHPFGSILSILLILASFGCAQKMTMEKISTPQIAFGSGGGFTNLLTEYYLLEDGKIVQKSKEGQGYTILTRIDRDKTTQCFAGSKIVNLDNLKFNEPGNMYYFITIRNDEKSENRIVWGSTDKPVPNEVKSFYKMLLNFLPKPKDDSK